MPKGALLRIKEIKKYPRYKRATKREIMLYYPREIDILKMGEFLYSNILKAMQNYNGLEIDNVANFLLKNEEDTSFILTTDLNHVINHVYEIDLTSKKITYCNRYNTGGRKVDLRKCIPIKFCEYYS